MTTEPTTLSQAREAGLAVRRHAVGTRQLLWRDLRTFGLPAVIFVGAYIAMMLLCFLFAGSQQDFRNVAIAIQAFSLIGLNMLWAVAAGAIVTAGDTEDGTDDWIRSLPIVPLRLFVVRSLVAFGSVLAVAIVCSIGMIWLAEPTLAEISPAWDQHPRRAPMLVGLLGDASLVYVVTSASFFISGLFSGVLTRRVLPSVILGAALPIVILVLSQTLFDRWASGRQGVSFPLFQGLLTFGIAIPALIYSARCYIRGLSPRMTSATTSDRHPLTGFRRGIAHRFTPTREIRSLAWRELVSLTLFVPWAIVVCVAAYFLNHPVPVFCLTMVVPLAAGLASATNDGRDESLQFLTNRGRSAFHVWFTKTLLWGLSTVVVVVGVSLVAEAINGAHPSDRWQIDVDQRQMGKKVVPSSALATIYASNAAADSLDSNQALFGPRRWSVIASIFALAATLFLLGQFVGFAFRRKYVAFAVAAFTAIFWMFLHTVLSVLATPYWAVSVVPILGLAILAYRFFRDALYQDGRWRRRAVLAISVAAFFLLSVPNSRILATPTASVMPVRPRPAPSQAIVNTFNELAIAFDHPLVLPSIFKSTLLSELEKASASSRGYGHLHEWLDSRTSASYLILVDREDKRDRNGDTVDIADDSLSALKDPLFEHRIGVVKAFVDAVSNDPAMPANQQFRLPDIVTGMTSIMAIDALARWHDGDDAAAVESWINAWRLTDYFARHDGEWTTSTTSTTSPWSLHQITLSRIQLLNLLHNQFERGVVKANNYPQLQAALVDCAPHPREELADAAYRVCIDGFESALRQDRPHRSTALALIERFLGLPATQRRTNYAGVAVLQRLKAWGSQAVHLQPSDAAQALGISINAVYQFPSARGLTDPVLSEHEVYQFIQKADEQFNSAYYPSELTVQNLYNLAIERTRFSIDQEVDESR